HPDRDGLGWHDAASRLAGPIVGDVAAHLAMRWHEVTGERVDSGAAPGPAGDTAVQLVRTVPEKVYDAVPHGDFRILEAYVRGLLWSEHLELPEDEVAAADPTALFDEAWRPLAARGLAEREGGTRLSHRLVQLPNASRRSRRLLGPLDSLIVDG